jgi:hypothetical protein
VGLANPKILGLDNNKVNAVVLNIRAPLGNSARIIVTLLMSWNKIMQFATVVEAAHENAQKTPDN